MAATCLLVYVPREVQEIEKDHLYVYTSIRGDGGWLFTRPLRVSSSRALP
jgi:hypothetical protein